MRKNIVAISAHVLNTMQTVKEINPEETTITIANPYQQEKEYLLADPIDGREARRKRRALERKNRKF